MSELTASDINTLREIERQVRYGSFGTDMIKNLVNGGYAKVVSGTSAYCVVSITPLGKKLLAIADAAPSSDEDTPPPAEEVKG